MTVQANATAVAWQSMKAVSGVSVTIERPGVGGPTALTAVPADTIVETQNDEGQTVRLKVRDYLVARSEFEAIAGAGEKPKRGDLIVETVADYTREFTTIELAGESSRWWDKGGLVLRIHTSETEKVTTTTAGA